MNARLALAACAAAALVAYAASADTRPGPQLANAGFEEWPPPAHCAPGWDCAAHADPDSFRFTADESRPATGRRSLCIVPVTHEPWGKVSQAVRSRTIAGRRVRFSIALRMEDVVGAGAGALAVVHGGSGQILDARRMYVTGTRDWQRVSVEIEVPPGFADLEVGAVLEGKGRACFDEARLEVLG